MYGNTLYIYDDLFSLYVCTLRWQLSCCVVGELILAATQTITIQFLKFSFGSLFVSLLSSLSSSLLGALWTKLIVHFHSLQPNTWFYDWNQIFCGDITLNVHISRSTVQLWFTHSSRLSIKLKEFSGRININIKLILGTCRRVPYTKYTVRSQLFWLRGWTKRNTVNSP